MTNRVSYAPQDFQKMCKQAERDHESKKLVVLMERVKRQIAERDNPGRVGEASSSESVLLRLPSRSAPLRDNCRIDFSPIQFLHARAENFSLSTS